MGGGGRPGVRAPVGGDGGDDDDDDDEEMSECEEGERSVAAVTAAAEEMDTETPEEARWAMGGPEEGGGEGLSLRDLFPHNALKEAPLRRGKGEEEKEEEKENRHMNKGIIFNYMKKVHIGNTFYT